MKCWMRSVSSGPLFHSVHHSGDHVAWVMWYGDGKPDTSSVSGIDRRIRIDDGDGRAPSPGTEGRSTSCRVGDMSAGSARPFCIALVTDGTLAPSTTNA